MIGTRVPDLSLPVTGGTTCNLRNLNSRKLILYFYPRDNTPGCTTEAQQFRDLHNQFTEAGALVIGVSRDSLKSHNSFRSKHDIPFALISDSEELLCSF